jgi:excisionase family DNA binding protein
LADERLMTQREAANYLHVSITTLQRWRKRGIGPPSTRLPNGYLRFRKADLDAWLRQHEADG